MKPSFLPLILLLGSFAVVASAQVDISPGVARISLLQGEVSTQRGDTGGWATAALNQPLVAGDRISTGDRSQAELQLDHANILRLGNNAQAKIAIVERTQIQVQVGQGLAYYTVSKDSEAEVEIDTPNVAIRPTSKEGVYRIEVSGFETQVIVRAGAADISTPQGSTRVEEGQEAYVRGTADEAGCVLGGGPSKDSWDSWNNDRDKLIRNAQSWDHTNRYFVGSEDLDANGHWVSVPEYGQVWSPTVAVGWVPYRAGRWLSEPYWGWTWVSNEPWGWTPYHYGRWFLYGTSWMWWPGPVDGPGSYRPEWAPAYVSFFGFDGHRGVADGFDFGSVGWLPVGPDDRFYPWYGQYGSHLNVVNVSDATDITNLNREFEGIAPLHSDNRFSNVRLAASDERVRKAVSALRADRFATGRSAPAAVSREAFHDGRMMTGNLPIVPAKETLSPANLPASSSSMMPATQRERFFTKKQPAAVPQSRDRQTAQVQEGIQAEAQVMPVREVARLDSAGTARPMPLANGVARTVQPAKVAPSGRGSKPRSGKGLHTAPSPRIQPAPARRMPALASGSGGAAALAASRPGGGSRTAPPARILRSKSTSARRMPALAPGSRGATARTVQSYVESASRQMNMGNYTAAIANYKQALQVGGNSAAAKARLERARRAMQAENEIIARR